MAVDLRSIVRKTWRTIASIETGVVLLILVVIHSAVGTIVLQRPVTTPEEMQSAYSPLALHILDAAGLTDVFHSWWFLGLVSLLGLCIVAASIDRFPRRWRYFSRPDKYPEESFRRALHPQKTLALVNRVADEEAGEEWGLAAAERALRSKGYNPERVPRQNLFGIFAEQHRISELAIYIVHSSLLLIFFGTIVDGLWGWRGTLTLNQGQSSNVVEMRDGKTRTLPFAIRCDSTGQENYKDGTAKKLWSRLAVIKDGQDVQEKEIVVNDPLLYSGFRFYQSRYGTNGKIDRLMLTAAPQDGSGQKQEIGLAVNDAASLDADTTVRFAEFFPDYAVRGGQVYSKSNELRNSVVHLVVTSKKAGKNFDVWLPQLGFAGNSKASWRFQVTELKVNHFTGLEVSHEPGEWGVWSGVVLMGIGLIFVFYVVHIRIWVVPVRDPNTGTLSLWIGGSANRNRDGFEKRFNDLVASIEKELKTLSSSSPGEQLAATGLLNHRL
jgi:cytochrome c biogenesis protein